MHCRGHMCWCHYRPSRCSHYCRMSWGCGSADNGSAAAAAAAAAADSGCAMPTESHSPRSRCRGCSRETPLQVRHRRNPHQTRSCRCLNTTESRSPRSRCRGCSRRTPLQVRHRRNTHQTRSCRCLSTVPWEGGCAPGEAERGTDRTRHGNSSALR